MPMRRLAAWWVRRAARGEALPLLIGLAVAVALWVFAEVAEEVLEGDPLPFDETLLRLLRQPGDPVRPVGPGWSSFAVAGDLIFAPDPEQVWNAALRSVGIDPAALPSWVPGAASEESAN